MQAGETLLETQTSIKLSFFSEMLNFEIVSILMAFVLVFFYGNTVLSSVQVS